MGMPFGAAPALSVDRKATLSQLRRRTVRLSSMPIRRSVATRGSDRAVRARHRIDAMRARRDTQLRRGRSSARDPGRAPATYASGCDFSASRAAPLRVTNPPCAGCAGLLVGARPRSSSPSMRARRMTETRRPAPRRPSRRAIAPARFSQVGRLSLARSNAWRVVVALARTCACQMRARSYQHRCRFGSATLQVQLHGSSMIALLRPTIFYLNCAVRRGKAAPYARLLTAP